MKKLLAPLAVAVLSFGGLVSTAPAQTIVDVVSASGGVNEFDNDPFDYDILLNAVIAADLVDALNNPADDLTVFAPNDRGFIRTAKDLGFPGNDEEGAFTFLADALGEGIVDVLLYHVAPESFTAFDFILASIFGIPIETAQGQTIQPFFFQIIDNTPTLRNPRLTWPINVQVENGIIHSINRVLIPAS